MTPRGDAIEKLLYSLPVGMTYEPVEGDETVPALLHLVNQPGDELRRVSAFILLVRSGVTVEVSIEGES